MRPNETRTKACARLGRAMGPMLAATLWHDDHWNVAAHALAADLLLEPTLEIRLRGTGSANDTSH